MKKDTQNNVEISIGNIVCKWILKEDYKKLNKKNLEVKKLTQEEPWWRSNRRWQQNKKNKNHGEISTP